MKTTYIPFFSHRKLLTKEIHARSLRYSSLIRFWKILLPFIAGSTVGALFFWPYLDNYLYNNPTELLKENVPEITLTNKLINPRLQTLDSQGRPIKLQAETATQTSDSAAEMIKPESQMHLKDGQSVVIRSDKGIYDQTQQSFKYTDNVELQSADGMVLKTTAAKVDMKNNQAESITPVTGEGPSGSLKGQGFKILKEGKEMHLIGKSKLTIK